MDIQLATAINRMNFWDQQRIEALALAKTHRIPENASPDHRTECQKNILRFAQIAGYCRERQIKAETDLFRILHNRYHTRKLRSEFNNIT